MSDVLVDSYMSALGAMTESGPKNLLKRATMEASEKGAEHEVGLHQLVAYLSGSSLNDKLRKHLHIALAEWDALENQGSTLSSPPRSQARRQEIYSALGLDDETERAFDQLFPVSLDEMVVISDTFEPWYTTERQQASNFYWRAYSRYLTSMKNWHPGAITSLDQATTGVVERLSDPMREEAYQAKGLVVGYVQSGKTANFTGVLAKAIDAGYRLLIVLTGTVDLLREQTQRRIDMELVGRENILRGVDPSDTELISTVDYQDDPDWDRFVKHSFLPSEQGLPDIVRLTTHRFDYKSLKAGITALEFERAVKMKPFYDQVNLPTSSARLVVVKKNKTVLQKLVKDLKSITARLGEIPALVIDDESDQASVNTSNPKKWQSDRPERTAINRLISEILRLLPRSQYVGYTATPFANVFIDPSDAEDVFPKDFLLSLSRPPGYMGIRDFHDLDSTVDPEDKTPANSQEKAHVRDLRGQGSDRRDELQEALDAFVLSGALKLYREATDLGSGYFKHHTMLVHESVRVADHAALAAEIRLIWRDAAYSSPVAFARLRDLYQEDFLPVCQAKGVGHFPNDFDPLRDFIGDVVSRVTDFADPVIVVNGDRDIAQEPIDFDRRRVWRVLVGGTKLSRGFTIEGLTISYYRRKTRQADTLMQMGRWFGFRDGYQDLVRLYIGREEPNGKTTLDLYEAFEAIVRDEELFREQLRQYSKLVDGKPQVTPAQIPPLVSQHLPWLKPAAANKMFNAKLVVRRSPGTPVEPTAYPKDPEDLSHNFATMQPILAGANTSTALGIRRKDGAVSGSFDAFVGSTSHEELFTAMNRLRWIVDGYFDADLEFLKELKEQVDDWVWIFPQTGRRGVQRNIPGVGPRSIFIRRRSRDPLFQAVSEPKHRPPALLVAGALHSYGDPAADELAGNARGAVLVYPMLEEEPHPRVAAEEVDTNKLVVGFTLVAPMAARASNGRLLKFVARNKADEKALTVDV